MWNAEASYMVSRRGGLAVVAREKGKIEMEGILSLGDVSDVLQLVLDLQSRIEELEERFNVSKHLTVTNAGSKTYPVKQIDGPDVLVPFSHVTPVNHPLWDEKAYGYIVSGISTGWFHVSCRLEIVNAESNGKLHGIRGPSAWLVRTRKGTSSVIAADTRQIWTGLFYFYSSTTATFVGSLEPGDMIQCFASVMSTADPDKIWDFNNAPGRTFMVVHPM